MYWLFERMGSRCALGPKMRRVFEAERNVVGRFASWYVIELICLLMGGIKGSGFLPGSSGCSTTSSSALLMLSSSMKLRYCCSSFSGSKKSWWVSRVLCLFLASGGNGLNASSLVDVLGE